MRSKIATALATGGLAALTLAALPGTAQANPEWYASPAARSGSSAVSPMAVGDCPSTYFCFWSDINYGGAMGKVAGDNPTWTAFRQPACPTGTWNDCASSGYNHGASGMGVRVYESANYGGRNLCLPKGWHHPEFTKVYWPGTSTSINDKISSNKWTWDC
ncbi:hypothetical protein ABIE67_004942 [Streptomyces sp. V4I8]|uniref:peptidase inhibitor family I36 protein n=1 Tax=Streptomyces sp. V4I8 TaxID=3156469 RepID=UPI0035195202